MEAVSLYVHIPFCIAKCDYCDFYSVPCKYIPDEYISALINEARFYKDFYKIKVWKTIYIGGGTPSLLSFEQLEKLLCGLQELCLLEKNAEVTIEMNPESLTTEHIKICALYGVTRISLGIQSLNPAALNAVNRHCSVESVKNALNIVFSQWQKDISLDVISGLPCQDTDDFIKSLQSIISYKPHHISLYSLTIEEGTPLDRKIQEGMSYDFDIADRQWLLGRDLLLKNGYKHYEVSNFALEGHKSVHNLSYWRQQDYIGIGAGAVGTIYMGEKDDGLRWNNTKELDVYIKGWHKKIDDLTSLQKNHLIELETLPPEIKEFEFIMMGLRSFEGISATEYKKRFSNIAPHYGNLKERLHDSNGIWDRFLQEKKAVEYNEEQFYLTEEGMLFLNFFLRNL